VIGQWSYGSNRCTAFFFYSRPSRTNTTVPSQPGSALRHREVVDCPEVADSVDASTCTLKTADIDGRARGKRKGFSPEAAVRHSQLARAHTLVKHLLFQKIVLSPYRAGSTPGKWKKSVFEENLYGLWLIASGARRQRD